MKQKIVKIIVFIAGAVLIILSAWSINKDSFTEEDKGQEEMTKTCVEDNTEAAPEDDGQELEKKVKTEEENETEKEGYGWFPDFPYETMGYIDEEAFQFIKGAYEDIDFQPEFKEGNLEEYDFYKKKYRQLLNNEVTLFDWENNEEVYLKDFTRKYYDDGLKNMDYSEYDFYLFDMNKDGTPELCIDHQRGYFLYVFRYDKEEDRMLLWRSIVYGWRALLGSRAVDIELSGGLYHRYTRYDEDGKETTAVNFFDAAHWANGKELYMVALPVYFDEQEKEIESGIPEEIKKQGYYDRTEKVYFFPITETQYEELMGDFIETSINAAKKREEMAYTYEELFGN